MGGIWRGGGTRVGGQIGANVEGRGFGGRGLGRHEVGGKWVRGVVEGRTWRDMSGVRGHPQWEEPALDPPSAVTQVWLCRSMWLPSLCPPTPPPSTVRAANPSTQCWVRPTSACGPTEASASSASRYCGAGGEGSGVGGPEGQRLLPCPPPGQPSPPHLRLPRRVRQLRLLARWVRG